MQLSRFLIIYLVCIGWGCEVNGRLQLVRNGYENLNIVIKDGVRENQTLLTRIMEVFTQFSKKMYKATKYRAYIRNITVVVPKSWETQSHYESIPAITSNIQLIVIKNQENNVGQAPFVTGNVECGKGGQVLQITPEFLMQEGETPYGLHDNVLLHEWGHLRWGLFDEYPSVKRRDAKGRKRYIQFYRSDGLWEPVRCTRNVYGKGLLNCNPETPCDVNKLVNIPEDCMFCPDPDQQTRSSLMSVQWLPALDSFCEKDDWQTEFHYRHNSRATNLQNTICKGQSAWEVMRKHRDFAGDANPSGPQNIDTTPYFRFVQRLGRVRVFVLDVSGSMQGDRLRRMQQTVELVIGTLVEVGSRMGLVQFSSNAQILAHLTQIQGEQDRINLINKIPKVATGGTSIGSGLRVALQVLDNSGVDKRECEIILVTDGENTNNPSISDVRDEVISSGVVVHTIAVSQAADQNLAQLAQDTNGRALTYLESDTISFADAMSQIISPPSDLADEHTPETLFSQGFTVSPSSPLTNVFRIDDGLGNSTTITVMTETATDVSLILSGPTNYRYEDSRQNTNTASFEISSGHMTGEYTFIITTTTETKVNIYVTSQPKSPDTPVLRVTSWLSTAKVDYVSNSPVTLFASVKKGDQPVLNANVMAVMESGAASRYIEMKDTGSGADTIAHDGVYSAYLINKYFGNNGRYNIKIKVTGNNSTFIWSSTLGSRAVINPKFAKGEYKDEEVEEKVDEFHRLSLPGELTVVNYDANQKDSTPPARILDFQTDNIMLDEYDSRGTQSVTFTFSWTAVGDDMDVGRALRYDIRMDTNFTSLQDDLGNYSQTINISSQTPKPSGELESLNLTFTQEDCAGTCYIGIRAMDEDGNLGDMSNIVSVEVDFPVPTTPAHTTIKTSGGNPFKASVFCLTLLLAIKLLQ